MKPFDFNREHQQWDLYKQFYYSNSYFVEFDDGSLIYHHASPTPDFRRSYDKYGIKIVGTTDGDCPQLYKRRGQREPIKKAWLVVDGIQYLAVDEHEGVAVRIGTHQRYGSVPAIPGNKSNATVYWPKANVMPVTNQQIDVSTVDRDLTNKLKEKLKDVRAAVTAIVRINPDKHKVYWTEKISAPEDWVGMSVEEIVADITSETNHPALAANIAKRGFTTPRRVEKFDYLFI